MVIRKALFPHQQMAQIFTHTPSQSQEHTDMIAQLVHTPPMV